VRLGNLRMPTKLGMLKDFDHLLELTKSRGKFFIKPCHSSSASGVIAIHLHKDRVIAQAPIEIHGDKLYNTLKIRRYTQFRSLEKIINQLTKENLFVEKWIRKSTHEGKAFDLRVVTTAGKASHIVMRTSQGPITNLHLGNDRGNVQALKRTLGDYWKKVIALAEQTAAIHSTELYLGIDILLNHSYSQAMVIEVNAFGDLLPNVLDLKGNTTYEAQCFCYLEHQY